MGGLGEGQRKYLIRLPMPDGHGIVAAAAFSRRQTVISAIECWCLRAVSRITNGTFCR
jgi:hypothetical protein